MQLLSSFFLGYFSHEIHVCKTVILASRWSTLLEIAGLSRYVSVGRGELTFIIMKNVWNIFVFIAFSMRAWKGMNDLDKILGN